MILKSFIVEKNISLLDNYYAVLFYGENIGLKDDLKSIVKEHNEDCEKISFHQNEIIKNPSLLNEQISNTSLFNAKKIIIINEFSEKLKKEIIEITQEIKKDVKIFLFSENLDRKSLTRSHFEKEKNLAVVPCYQDNEKTLSIYLRTKLNGYQGLNQELTNILIKNSGMDRKVLSQEIEKIKSLFLTKKIDQEKVIKLINNANSIDFDNLRDACMEANIKELNKNLGNAILQNEKSYFYLNSISNRIQKLKDLNGLLRDYKNADEVIDNITPKIFWKDKPVFKKQMMVWNNGKLEKAMKIVCQAEVRLKTKLTSMSDIIIKNLLVELCSLANTNS